MWILHNIFKFGGDDPEMYQRSFSDSQWQKILEAFPKKVPTAGVNSFTEAKQIYSVNIRKTTQNAKCASCKQEICKNDVQATTEGPYHTIHQIWIKRAFFFCPRLQCISKLPRYSLIVPYKIGMTLKINPDMEITEKLKNDLALE